MKVYVVTELYGRTEVYASKEDAILATKVRNYCIACSGGNNYAHITEIEVKTEAPEVQEHIIKWYGDDWNEEVTVYKEKE